MSPAEKRLFANAIPVHVGVDTGKTFHVLVARGPDGRESKPIRVPVSRDGFSKSAEQLHAPYPSLGPERTLVGLEFAGHHGFTYAPSWRSAATGSSTSCRHTPSASRSWKTTARSRPTRRTPASLCGY